MNVSVTPEVEIATQQFSPVRNASLHLVCVKCQRAGAQSETGAPPALVSEISPLLH